MHGELHIYDIVTAVIRIHRINMELDLQSLFGLHVHSFAVLIAAGAPQLPPPPLHPAFGLI